MLWLVALLSLISLVASGCVRTAQPPVALPAFDAQQSDPTVADLREQADAVDDLTWLLPPGMRSASPGLAAGQRPALLAERQRLLAAGDRSATARVNAILAGEAFARAARVVDRWMGRRDPATGLFPKGLTPEAQAWVYGDTGADLYGHLAIGARFLAPEHYSQMLGVLAAERRLGPNVPDNVSIPSGQPRGLSHDERIFGVAEYAKDGLLPLLERLGPDPWLGRLVELADAILAESRVPTPHGLIPADSAEVNGDMLQVLARLSWATGEPRFRAAADRIAMTYLDVLPTTRYLPPNRWDFLEQEPLDRRRFRLSDHGNEILSGLLEWHLGETLRNEPGAPAHRELIRRMLDRLLEKGRNPDELWYRVVEIPSGRVDQDGLTDNYGYVLQSYLMAAIIEERAPDGDAARAGRYRQAARAALQALPRYRYYEWQKGEMDGYADAIESALYLMEGPEAPGEGGWVDDQIPVLYGFQASDGTVLDGYLDGNFIRTALLYGFTRTAGLRLEPWREGTLVGGARDGSCLAIWVASPTPWSGQLIFDTPRHRMHLRLPVDYARLNKWPEWFTVESDDRYEVEDSGNQASGLHAGSELSDGLALRLEADTARWLRVCPAAP